MASTGYRQLCDLCDNKGKIRHFWLLLLPKDYDINCGFVSIVQ